MASFDGNGQGTNEKRRPSHCVPRKIIDYFSTYIVSDARHICKHKTKKTGPFAAFAGDNGEEMGTSCDYNDGKGEKK